MLPVMDGLHLWIYRACHFNLLSKPGYCNDSEILSWLRPSLSFYLSLLSIHCSSLTSTHTHTHAFTHTYMHHTQCIFVG